MFLASKCMHPFRTWIVDYSADRVMPLKVLVQHEPKWKSWRWCCPWRTRATIIIVLVTDSRQRSQAIQNTRIGIRPPVVYISSRLAPEHIRFARERGKSPRHGDASLLSFVPPPARFCSHRVLPRKDLSRSLLVFRHNFRYWLETIRSVICSSDLGMEFILIILVQYLIIVLCGIKPHPGHWLVMFYESLPLRIYRYAQTSGHIWSLARDLVYDHRTRVHFYEGLLGLHSWLLRTSAFTARDEVYQWILYVLLPCFHCRLVLLYRKACEIPSKRELCKLQTVRLVYLSRHEAIDRLVISKESELQKFVKISYFFAFVFREGVWKRWFEIYIQIFRPRGDWRLHCCCRGAGISPRNVKPLNSRTLFIYLTTSGIYRRRQLVLSPFCSAAEVPSTDANRGWFS